MKYAVNPEKVIELEDCVMKKEPGAAAELIEKDGLPIFTARAFGLACRYRGLDMVKTLAEHGAAFKSRGSGEERRRYNELCHTPDNHDDDKPYCELLLDEPLYRWGHNYFSYRFSIERAEEEYGRKPLPKSERLDILSYLLENGQSTGLDTGILLLYAYLQNDREFVSALKNSGAKFSREAVTDLTGGEYNLYNETAYFLGDLSKEEFIPTVKALLSEITESTGEKRRILFRESIWYAHPERYKDPVLFRFLLDNFKKVSIEKRELMRKFIDEDNIGCLEAAAEHKWLKKPGFRDEMTEYAVRNQRAESAAWLIQYRKEHANIALEEKRKEQRLRAELNAAPDAPILMDKLWKWNKLPEGAVILKAYRGNSTEIKVPRTVNGVPVTVIGDWAFSPHSHEKSTPEDQRLKKLCREITEVTLPDTITEIRSYAFYGCNALKTVNIPRSVKEIGEAVFKNRGDVCVKLYKGSYAEEYCKWKKIPYIYEEDQKEADNS